MKKASYLALVVAVIAGLGIIYYSATYHEVEVTDTVATGKIDLQEEWSNEIKTYLDADFVKSDITGAFFKQSESYSFIGFTYNGKYYSKTEDCDDANYGYEEEFHYSCRRDDDEQNLYIRLTNLPGGKKIPHPQITNTSTKDEI